jgi:hypothetical protein
MRVLFVLSISALSLWIGANGAHANPVTLVCKSTPSDTSPADLTVDSTASTVTWWTHQYQAQITTTQVSWAGYNDEFGPGTGVYMQGTLDRESGALSTSNEAGTSHGVSWGMGRGRYICTRGHDILG